MGGRDPATSQALPSLGPAPLGEDLGRHTSQDFLGCGLRPKNVGFIGFRGIEFWVLGYRVSS